MKVYHQNIEKYSAKLIGLKKKLNRISLLRLFIFVASAISVIVLFSSNLMTMAFFVLAASIISFAYAIKYYNKTSYQKKHTEFLIKINQSEILRSKCSLKEFDDGNEFINSIHPYTSDLDIFGQHSLFQLVNRTTTESGRFRLSEWLTEPALKDEIFDRQKAIAELSHKLTWRQNFQASGMHYYNKEGDYGKLLLWADTPNVLFKKRWFYQIMAVTLSMLSLLSVYLFIDNLLLPQRNLYLTVLMIVLLINILILRKVRGVVESIVETAQINIKTCKGYRALIKRIESEQFESKKLNQLKSSVSKGEYSAFKEINRLCRLLDFSEQRGIKNRSVGGNYFYHLLNAFLIIDIYVIIGAEKWKLKNKHILESWLRSVSEFEVINCFSGFSYSNPSYTFSEITEKSNRMHFEQMGHPLINVDKRICNNFQTNGHGNVVMVTGSNMGGKSTFLRTVGINLVLALAGAPCCASFACVSNLKLYTSMRTQDNLEEGVSSFYAELERIEKMLELMNSSKNVFFLLDEMFKGTNSEDRHKGGYSLIQQVSSLQTSGIIATHDIELARLSERNGLVTNYSFNSEILDNSMVFSYKLDPGICNDFNASALMEKIGIKLISDIPSS